MRLQYIFSETSPAAAGTAASSAAVSSAANYLPAGVAGPLDDCDAVDLVAELVGATGGALDVYVQYSPNDGVTWYDCAHFPQLAAGASAVIYKTTLSLHPQQTAAPVVIGKDATPALAVNTTVQGPWGDRLRLLFVAGSSTSAGAAVKVTVTGQRPDTWAS